MQIQIKTNGDAQGTQILVDGDRVPYVTEIRLKISIETGKAVLEIDRHATNENGRWVVEKSGFDSHIVSERYVYCGELNLDGELIEKLTIDDLNKVLITQKLDKLTREVEKLAFAINNSTHSN